MKPLVTAVPDILLNNGKTIPQFGFGVFQIQPADTVEAVTTALDLGYRHIDTAQMYGNEAEVGEAIAKYDIDRSEVFVTSKLNNGNHRPDDARRSFDETLNKLDTDYVDLFLIHWPLPTRYDGDYVSTWKTLEEFYADGRARSIGVSNFNPHHLRRLHEEATVVPAVNQIEVHPFLTQDDVRAFCGEHQIAVEAWSPIAQGAVLDDPTINEIAQPGRQVGGPGGAALAHRARGHRVPEVGDARAHQGEHRHLRLRAVRRGRRRDQRPGQGRAHRAGPGHLRLHPVLNPRLTSTASMPRRVMWPDNSLGVWVRQLPAGCSCVSMSRDASRLGAGVPLLPGRAVARVDHGLEVLRR